MLESYLPGDRHNAKIIWRPAKPATAGQNGRPLAVPIYAREVPRIGNFAPIFVVGMPRSGTTLLAALLSAHSQLAIGPETAYFDLVWKPLERGQDLTVWPEVERVLAAWLEKPSVALMELPVAALLDEWHSAWTNRTLSHRLILARVMETFAVRQGKVRWGEKTPGHFLFVPAIKGEYPDAQIVYIVRDPRDIHLSLAKVSWNTGNAFNHAVQWREYQAICQRYLARYGSSVIVLRYEDLVSDPGPVLQRLTEQLGLRFEQSMLSRYREQPLFDLRDEPWKQRVATAIDAANAGKWRTQLNRDLLGIFQTLCGSSMRRLGYDFLPGAKFSATLAVRGLDVHSLMWWGRMVWRISRGRDPWLGSQADGR